MTVASWRAARRLRSLPWLPGHFCPHAAAWPDVSWLGAHVRLAESAPARSYAGAAGTMNVFDRELKAAHRDRAARLLGPGGDALQRQIAERLADRLQDTVREFPTCLVLGGAAEHVLPRLPASRAQIKKVYLLDASQGMLKRWAKATHALRTGPGEGMEFEFLLADEERVPLESGTVDVVLAPLGLHWVNDLPRALAECRRVLRPDGMFLAAMVGGETLQEMRIALSVAEMERRGGVSARVSPMARVRDGGNLLERAGFALPTVDVDEVEVMYEDATALVRHLRALGESNAVASRPPPLRLETFLAAAAVYEAMFGKDGPGPAPSRKVPATVSVMYLSGWAPHKDQPRAAKRGSATVSLTDLAKLEEPGEAPKGRGNGEAGAGGG